MPAEPFSLAVLRDFREEQWPSMDLTADMLMAQLPHVPDPPRVVELVPPYRRILSRIPVLGGRAAAQNADRLLNRMWSYPRAVRIGPANYDAWHVCDHSYAQLVLELPAERTGVYCHDLDTFRSVLDPEAEPRPGWYRRMAARILSGFQRAGIVFHSTREMRDKILELKLIDADRLVHAPLGISPEFTAEASDRSSDGRGMPTAPFLLHVGSSIPRKRLDVLLEVFARLRGKRKELRLVQIGGEWTPEQRAIIERLRLDDAIEQRRGLSREELAELYRRALVVLQPSEAEGFGIPVIEALACGALVVASDLPVLREVGGEAVVYAPVGDIESWSAVIEQMLDAPGQAPSLESRLACAAQYTWARHAEIIAESYRQLVRTARGRPCAE